MSKKMVLVKTPTGFDFATDADKEKASSWKMGKPIKCEIKEQSARSLRFHKMYWGGLLELTIHYWEPDGGMTTESERALIMKFCGVLDDDGGGGEVSIWGEEFLSKLAQNRAEKTQVTHKSKSDLHEWIKEKIGHYEVFITPSGPKKRLRETNFNAMGSEEFRDFYKKAFSLCWRYLLSQKFSSENEAQRVINQMTTMG